MSALNLTGRYGRYKANAEVAAVPGAHDTATNQRGSAKRIAAFTLQHGAMLTPRQPEGCVPVVVSSPCSR